MRKTRRWAERDVQGDQLPRTCPRVGDVRAGPAAGVEHTPAAQPRQVLVEKLTQIELRLAQLVDRRTAGRGHPSGLVIVPVVDARHPCMLAGC